MLELRTSGRSRCLIELRGELDVSSVEALDQELHLAEGSDAAEIVVDLDRLTFMDSSGLHVLLRAFSREPERLRLLPGPPQVQSVFRLTRTDSILPFAAATGGRFKPAH